MAADLQKAVHATVAIVQRQVDAVQAQLRDAGARKSCILTFAGIAGEAGHLLGQPLVGQYRQDQ